ncbi:MAG TPA: oligosaccharide flippase family protein, partial [Candidatus Bathyarchaeia archaeon]|nr:oligosaccharide flippase family protein [Candidatus Bathyarchaeia archaeon]
MVVGMPGASRDSNSSDQHVHFTRGASYLIIQNLSLNALSVVSFIILARLISPKEMGIWAVLNLIIAVASTFVTWYPQAVTKFVAENISKGLHSQAAASFYQALRVNVIVYIPAIIGFYLGAPFLASHLLGDVSYAPLFRVVAFDVFLNAGVLQLLVAALLGLQMFRETAAIGLLVNGLLRQVLIISLIVLMRNFLGLVVGWLISD